MGLCMATERLIGNTPPKVITWLHTLIFGSTLLVYNTPRIIKRHYGKKRRPQKFRFWYWFFLIAGLAMTVISLCLMPAIVQLWSIGLGVFAFSYFLPVLPFKNKKRIRDFGWLKIAVLALVWTTATAILPILYWQKNIADYPFEVILRLLFIFALCVLFDIRDMQKDLENNISTLPNKVGIRNSYGLIHLSLLMFIIVSLVQYMRFPNVERLVGALATAIITAIVATYLRKKPSDRAYAALADGVMLVYALVVLI